MAVAHTADRDGGGSDACLDLYAALKRQNLVLEVRGLGSEPREVVIDETRWSTMPAAERTKLYASIECGLSVGQPAAAPVIVRLRGHLTRKIIGTNEFGGLTLRCSKPAMH